MNQFLKIKEFIHDLQSAKILYVTPKYEIIHCQFVHFYKTVKAYWTQHCSLSFKGDSEK